MEDYPATSLRKISSAKKKRRSGRTPRKTTVTTGQTQTSQSPAVVTRQTVSKNARKSQTTAPRCTSGQHLTADIRDFPSDTILCPQSPKESDVFSALNSSDTDFFLADIDITSVERENFSQGAALVPHISTDSCNDLKRSQSMNEHTDMLSDAELFDNSSDIFEGQCCGEAVSVDDQIRVNSDSKENSAIKIGRPQWQDTCNEHSPVLCQTHDSDITGVSEKELTSLPKPDIVGKNTEQCDISDGCDARRLSPHATELRAQDYVQTCVDFDKVNHFHCASTPKSSTTANCGQNLSARSTGISSRLKRALQQNARCSTPQNTRAQQLREDRVTSALKESKCGETGPFYGLPAQVQQLFDSQRGITKLYAWQEECLSLAAVREHRNLIYSLPTSGGKTLVAEVLMLRELLYRHRDVLFILPFVSIVQEKVRGLSEFGLALDFLVEEYAGAKGQMPPRQRRKNCVYIATIEKANSLINSLTEDGRLDSIGLVVVDELHMLGEGGSRGAVLEMSLVKVMHASAATQVVGMSATLANISHLQTFLNADIYRSDFRPVALQEFVKFEDNVYQVLPGLDRVEERVVHSRVCVFQYDRAKTRLDPDHVAALVLEVAPQYSCLVFCATKKNCENVAQLICQFMTRERKNVKQTERHLLLKALKHAGNGHLCPVLRKTVVCGVAYHHGGLTTDERKLIEEAYAGATLCVLTCTSTLAAGVNLPAKRVILRSPYVGMGFISRSQYKQMTGRAGRAGIDSSGESIVICQTRDKQQLLELLGGPVERCVSSLLYEGGKGLRRLLLTAIGLKLTTCVQSVHTFLRRTLCHVQSTQLDVDLVSLASTELQTLLDAGLVKMTSGQNGQLEVTSLGRATFKGSVDIDRANQLYTDLRTALQSLTLANHLHLLYLVTPYDLGSQVRPSWMTYFNQMNNLDESELKVAALVGVSESYITKKASGQRTRKHVDEDVVERFYLTLILYSLWRQQSVWEVAAKFQLPRGFIQQLLTGAASFASCVLHFSQELDDLWALQDLLPGFVKRLSYCVTMELLPLVEIPAVSIGRARQLYKAGYKTLQQVAYAESSALVKAIEFLSHKAAKQIIASAKLLLTEKVESLRDEADVMTTIPVDMPTETVTMATEPNSSQASSLTLSRSQTSERS